MSRSRKMLDMLKEDEERPELSLTFSNIPVIYKKKSVNAAANVDFNSMTKQTSPLPPGAEEIGQELADVWEEVLREDRGTKEITRDKSAYNVMTNLSTEDTYSNQPSTFSLEVHHSENSPLMQVEELLEVSHHRSTPVNLELSVPTPMPSPTNVSSIDDSTFCPNRVDSLSAISSQSFSTIYSPATSYSSDSTVTPKTTRKRQRRPKKWIDLKRKCLKNLGKKYVTKKGKAVDEKTMGPSSKIHRTKKNKLFNNTRLIRKSQAI